MFSSSSSMQMSQSVQQAPQQQSMHQRRKGSGFAASLRIQPPAPPQQIALALADDTSTLSSADSDFPPFAQHSARSTRKNMKKLSLSLSSAQSSVASLHIPAPAAEPALPSTPGLLRPERPRRPSIISLPATNVTSALIHRKEEDGGSPSVPYADGPIQVIPGVWIGSEDNARDWQGLLERGIKSILNVAKEVASPFDSLQAAQSLRPAVSTPNFKSRTDRDPTYYPPHLPSGRPAMHYLKLQWSHGQQNLVADGFQAGFAFADAALARGEGCLIHCQCGISRSATMVIALVMRAAAERQSSVPPEIWALPGMQGAYSFVKEKSAHVGPNMSLIYQLLEYEKKLKGDKGSPSDSENSSGTDDEEEWGRRRKLMEEEGSDNDLDERESSIVMQEARALDKAMEDRIVARKASTSSMSVSSNGSGFGMGPAWRSRYAAQRKRTGSIASMGSFISEDLVEEEEEQELLGVGSGFDTESRQSHTEESSATSSPDDDNTGTPRNVSSLMGLPSRSAATAASASHPPPSAPVWKTSFSIPPPPATAIRAGFNLPPRPKPKTKFRPTNLSLPPVPSSPVTLVIETDEQPVAPEAPQQEQQEPQPQQPSVKGSRLSTSSTISSRTFTSSNSTSTIGSKRSSTGSSSIKSTSTATSGTAQLALPPVRQRADSRRPVPPPLHLRSSVLRKASNSSADYAAMTATPSQTLFVFPPSPTLTTRTPSTMTLMSSAAAGPVPFPSLATPRVSTFQSKGRTRSFIGVGAPPTPTVAFSKVDARGYVGLG
ncbi:hypothetical protein D9619_003033 [Psilocybe cf. subviscida]|uniref:protein-tyrosine-phosphatase n=1 Tax=Psilocybe cf. subviscida TaxID=2480587 RepID=A0A8H5EV76_9AGAR|nr:hypothetical protein D9619_003033 [Psilocybe cf. subviscida]